MWDGTSQGGQGAAVPADPPAGKPVLVEPKTERSRRTLDLPAPVAEALRQHRARQVEERLQAGPFWRTEWNLVFCTERGLPLNPRQVLIDLKRILAAANLPVVRFHDLRHSCASLLLLAGVPDRMVMEVLGHSNIATTKNTYMHILPQLREQAVRAQEAFLGG